MDSGVHAYNFDFDIWVEGEGQDTSRLFLVVLGPCTQFYQCEASEQKWGQTQKLQLPNIKFDPIRFVSKNKQFEIKNVKIG